MENNPVIETVFPSLDAERIHLERLYRRIVYLEQKVKSLGVEGKNTIYEIAEYDAIKWAYNIALSAHRTNKRFHKYFAVKFAAYEVND